MKTKHVLFVIAAVVILYLIYQHNKKNEQMTPDTTAQPAVQSGQVATASNNTPVLGVYYTEWCGYSQQFLDQLNNGTGEAVQKAGAKIELIDCEKDKETCAKYEVQGFPTLLLHTSKGVVPYNGHRSGDAIAEFITQNK
jgi:thioredoxin-like negative regulator of GroEL